MRWDAAAYSAFADERLRPAGDLIANIPDIEAQSVFDLGCGTGAATRLHARRWPGAAVTGVDGSAEMLAEARRSEEPIRWLEADLASWAPDGPADLLFSNAALHWLDDHAALFSRLLAHLAPGGVLAVQMPDNFAAPSHTAIAEVAGLPRWRGRTLPVLRPAPVLRAAAYLELLIPLTARVEVWETTYWHLLRGPDPVAAWTRGSALRPVLAVLDREERDDFLKAYTRILRAAYPRRDDGVTLFAFRRLFIVAAR